MTPASDSPLTRGRIILISVLFVLGVVSLFVAVWFLREWVYAPGLGDLRPPDPRSTLNGEEAYEISDVTGLSRGRRDKRRIVRLFFTRNGRQLSAEEILVPGADANPEEILADVMEKLLSGPLGEGLSPVLPAKTALRSSYIRGQTAYVDFSEDIRSPLGGPHVEWLCVQSVALSIAETIPSVQQIRILVEGEPVEILWEYIDLSAPIFPDRSVVGG